MPEEARRRADHAARTPPLSTGAERAGPVAGRQVLAARSLQRQAALRGRHGGDAANRSAFHAECELSGLTLRGIPAA